MFLYRDILKKSLSITFTHKNLWFFGIFASLIGGVGQYSMSLSQSPENWTTSLFSAAALIFGQTANRNVVQNYLALIKYDPASAIVFTTFILIILIVSLFILWLAVTSQAGLVNNGAVIIKNNNRKESVPLGQGFAQGVKKFWPVFGLDLIGAALTCFLAALVGAPLVFMTAQANQAIFLIYVLLFIVFIPLALIISFVIKYAVNFSVIKERKFVDAFTGAWRLFGKYWLISLEMALILFMIDFLFVFVLLFLLLALAIPYIFLARILSLAIFMVVGVDSFFQVTLTSGLLLAVIVIILGGAIVTVFKTLAWTDIFITLVDKKGGVAKLERMAAGLKK